MSVEDHISVSRSQMKPFLPALLILWLILIVFQLFKAFHTSIWLDDALFSNTAKNLILGNGYSTTVFDRTYLFERGISSGPIIILPAAAMMRLFGNTSWAPGLASVLLINILLIANYLQLKRLIRPDVARWQCAFLFLFAAMLVTNHNMGLVNEKMHLWHGLMGEVPSALFIIMGALRVAENPYGHKTVFAGGIIAGMAGLCKLLAMVGAAAIGCYLLISYIRALREGKAGIPQLAGNIFAYGTGMFLPLLLFEAVKIFSFGDLHYYLGNIKGVAMAVREVDNTPALSAILKKIYLCGELAGICHAEPAPSVAFYMSLLAALIGFFSIPVIFFRQVYRQSALPETTPVHWACNALMASCIAHFLWYVFITNSLLPRYMLEGVLYACAVLALWQSGIALNDPAKGRRYFLIIVLALACMRYDAVAYYWTGMQQKDRFTEQQQLLQKLNDIKVQRPGTIFFSCGDIGEFEYLMPTAKNFRECERLHDPEFAKNDKVLVSILYSSKRKLLHWIKGSFFAEERYNPADVLQVCPDNDIYTGRYYSAATCRTP